MDQAWDGVERRRGDRRVATGEVDPAEAATLIRGAIAMLESLLQDVERPRFVSDRRIAS